MGDGSPEPPPGHVHISILPPDRHSRAPIVIPAQAGTTRATKLRPALKHPAALERHLGSPSECRDMYRRWRHPDSCLHRNDGKGRNDCLGRWIPNSSLPPFRGEVRWGVEGSEPPPGHIHTSIPPTVIPAPPTVIPAPPFRHCCAPIVIPAQAGTTRATKLRPTPDLRGRSNVTWAALGMLMRTPTLDAAWIAAYAGMTIGAGIAEGARDPQFVSPLFPGEAKRGRRCAHALVAARDLSPPT